MPLRHALYRRRTLRVDLLAIPRQEPYRRIALGFEVKGHKKWETKTIAQCLKQTTDYVLASVEPGVAPREHTGKRVMAAFMYPEIPIGRGRDATWDDGEFAGMVHFAGYHRVGSVRTMGSYRALWLGQEVWSRKKGWRLNALNVLIGKRQIGAQRFPILEELEAMDAGAGTR